MTGFPTNLTINGHFPCLDCFSRPPAGANIVAFREKLVESCRGLGRGRGVAHGVLTG